MSQSDRPEVTVILTTYNRPELVERALRSVDSQTYGDVTVELIETPTSGSKSVISIPEDLTVTINHQLTEPETSVTEARNIGLEDASGQYIAFLDDDDEWMPEKIEKQVRCLQKSGERVKANITGDKKISPSGGVKTVSLPNSVENWVERGLRGSIGTFSTLLIEHSILNTVGTLDERLENYEDHDFTLRIAQEYDFSVIREPLVLKHVDHGDQLGGNYSAKIRAQKIFEQKHGGVIREHQMEDDVRSYFEFFAGQAARSNGEYGRARRHFLRSLVYKPTQQRFIEFLVTLGGPISYEFAKWTRKWIHSRAAAK